MGRSLVGRLVLLIQAVLLIRYSPALIATTFIQSRYSAFHGKVVGMLSLNQQDIQFILDRTFSQ